ncbi:MAG TPA: P-loop NTPase fold protein [Verrucomicrobiae bacterium]|nr:P-loop NTPase fold protein [Verrucomicrobiae bacterium]
MNPSLKRWLELTGYSSVGALLFVYGQPLLLQPSGWLEAAVPVVNLRILILLTGGWFCLWKLNALFDVRPRHFRQLICYPPTAITIPVSLLMAAFLPIKGDGGENLADNSSATLSVCLAFYALVLTMRFCFQQSRGTKVVDTQAPANSDSNLQDLSGEEVCRWLQREEPIKSSAQDYFGLAERVGRIKSGLKNSAGQTVALVGSFGCGKSSLVNLIEINSSLAGEPRLLFCKVSCWGFDDSAAAQEVILNQAISRLSEEVDCFKLRGLPARYIKALSKTSGAVEAIVQLVEERPDPLMTLKKFKPLLSAIKAKLIVVIEDADRNGEKFDISYIQALLQRLRQVEGLSFIICAGPNTNIAFAKLCEHIETIPDLGEDQILSVAERVRKICREKFPQDIDPHSGRKPLDDKTNRILGSLWMSTYISWQEAVARLMQTPRMLKRTLLRFSLVWDRLHGEVDVDELMMSCCLRICVPQAFQFICQHSVVLGNLAFYKTNDFTQKDKDAQVKRLTELWGSVQFESEAERDAAATVIQKLFPASESVFKMRSYSDGKSLQGIDSRGVVNYFERLVSEDILPSEVRDQNVFHLIYNANDDGRATSALAEAIVSSDDFARAFEQHSKALRDERLLMLASAVYATIRNKIGCEADRDSNGFSEVWRVVEKRMRWQDAYGRWPVGEIEPCLHRHLRLLTDIYYFWLVREKIAVQRDFRKALLQACKSKFHKIPASEFVDAFDPNFPFTLFHLIFTSEFKEKPRPPLMGYRFWKWMAPLLVESIKVNPIKFAPQVAVLLEAKMPSGRDPSQPVDFQFDLKFLENFFGNLKYNILTELSKPIEYPWSFDPRLKAALALVPERARELLQQWRG